MCGELTTQRAGVLVPSKSLLALAKKLRLFSSGRHLALFVEVRRLARCRLLPCRVHDASVLLMSWFWVCVLLSSLIWIF